MDIVSKLPLDVFELKKKTTLIDIEKFIKNHDKNKYIGHILKVDAEYPKNLDNLHNDLPFLLERIKITIQSLYACMQSTR